MNVQEIDRKEMMKEYGSEDYQERKNEPIKVKKFESKETKD